MKNSLPQVEHTKSQCNSLLQNLRKERPSFLLLNRVLAPFSRGQNKLLIPDYLNPTSFFAKVHALKSTHEISGQNLNTFDLQEQLSKLELTRLRAWRIDVGAKLPRKKLTLAVLKRLIWLIEDLMIKSVQNGVQKVQEFDTIFFNTTSIGALLLTSDFDSLAPPSLFHHPSVLGSSRFATLISWSRN